MRRRNVPLAALSAALLVANVRAGGARILDAGLGYPSFPTPQAAIDAAPEGAAILVGSGNYNSVVISAKSVSVFAMPGATVNVASVSISNLAASQTVVVSGLRAQAGPLGIPLSVSNCAGWVRCESCSFHAYDNDWGGCDFGGDVIYPGYPGAVVASSSRVVLRACTLTGGRGESTYGDSWLGACVCNTYDSHGITDANGGAGLEVQGIPSRVALFDCSLTGGDGGSAEACQGYGGDGLWMSDGSAFASACTLRGGSGGNDIFNPPQCGATGGNGAHLVTSNTATLRVLGTTSIGGASGFPHCAPTSAPYYGPPPTFLPGTPGVASFAQVVLGDRSDLSIAYQGGGFDQVVLAYGSRSPSRLVFGIRGPVLLKGDPYVALFELGTASGAGALQAALPMPDVASGSGSLRPIVQILSGSGSGDPTGRWTPGDAASLLLLDRDPGPDCDGDGLNDLIELIEHPERDANHNLIPDACPGG